MSTEAASVPLTHVTLATGFGLFVPPFPHLRVGDRTQHLSRLSECRVREGPSTEARHRTAAGALEALDPKSVRICLLIQGTMAAAEASAARGQGPRIPRLKEKGGEHAHARVLQLGLGQQAELGLGRAPLHAGRLLVPEGGTAAELRVLPRSSAHLSVLTFLFKRQNVTIRKEAHCSPSHHTTHRPPQALS